MVQIRIIDALLLCDEMSTFDLAALLQWLQDPQLILVLSSGQAGRRQLFQHKGPILHQQLDLLSKMVNL